MSGYLIFGGIDSRDYDVFVSFSDIDTVPRRVYTKVDIVGKNGAVLIDEGKYEDVPHSYDCIVLDNEKRVAFVNAIMSKKGYQRLTDSYGTDEYYTAVLEENIEQKTTRVRDKFKFKLVFTRKPQRFLTSGEEPIDTSELGGDVTTDKIPYLLRRSGGGDIGHDFDAEIDKIIGGTVAWNQAINGVENYSNTSTDTTNYFYLFVRQGVNLTERLFWNEQVGSAKSIDIIRASVNNNKGIHIYHNGSQRNLSIYINADYQWINEHKYYFHLDVVGYDPTTVGGLVIKNVMLIDLTALFGSAEIADYVHSLEQTTAGAGVAWLKSHGFIDGSYRAYDSGSLQSVKTSEHRTTGFNQWDEEWENGYLSNKGIKVDYAQRFMSKNFIPVLPNTTYFIKTPSNTKICQYSDTNATNAFIKTLYDKKDTTFNTEANCRYIRISIDGTTYNHDICINISDASKNGQYEPYESHSYPLDPNLELRGLFKLDANNALYADGDIYPPSGEVGRVYSEPLDLGTLNWVYLNDMFCARLDEAKATDAYLWNLISNSYVTTTAPNYVVMADKEMLGTKGYMTSGRITLMIKDSAYTDAAVFKQHLTDIGAKLVYELATPTTEQADPYASPQVVNPLGIEEYVDTRDVPVPVGHETKYGMSQLVLTNPTDFPSKPLLEVTGVGTFWLGDTLFTITGTAGQTIYIDCETGEAWKNVGGIITPANGLVTLNRLDFPELDPGDTPVMYGTGITKVVVTPRWWII